MYTAVRAPPSQGQQSAGKRSDALDEKGFTEGDMVVLSVGGELLCGISLGMLCVVKQTL